MLFLLVWLSAVGLSAQTGFMGHSSGGYCKLGGPCTMTAPILLPTGSPTAAALAYSAEPDNGLWFGTGLVYLQNQGSGDQTGRSVFSLQQEIAQIYTQSSGDAAKRVTLTFTDTGADVMQAELETWSAATTYAGFRVGAQTGGFFFNTAGGGEKDIFQLGTGGITLCDQADDTKCINNVFSGITTATTRSVSWPDDAGVVAVETATDDMVLTADGTRWVGKAMPTTGTNGCAGATADKLLYNTATNTWSCGADQTAFDPSTSVDVLEEFLGGRDNTSYIGSMDLMLSLVSTGTGGQETGTDINHPGLYRLNSHVSNDDSGAILSFGGTTPKEQIWTGSSGEEWAVDVLLEIGSVGTIADSFLYVGLSSSASNLYPTDGYYVRRDTDLAETNFEFVVCRSGGCGNAADTTTVTYVEDSTITPSAGNWYRFRIRYDEAGVGGNPTVYFRINDETEVTFCSAGCDSGITFPSATLVPIVSYWTRTTTGVKSSDVDYIRLTWDSLSRY
jgi:hypothetical protein